MPAFFVLGVLVCGLASAGGAAATVAKSNGFSYAVDKRPTWVVPPPEAVDPGSSPGRKNALEVLDVDTQVNLAGSKEETFFRVRSVANERSALEALASISIQFNPSFQSLTFHDIALIRDGKRADRLKTARISLTQREAQLEQRVYDELVTAIVAIDDVRVGDVVEFSYTLRGANPLFEGRFSGYFGLNTEFDTSRLSIRVNYPASRRLWFKVHGADLKVDETERGQLKTISLNARNLPGLQLEPAVPRWVKVYPWLQVTEYRSWSEVERWAEGVFAVPQALGPGLEKVVSQIEASSRTDEERISAALAFVQDEIRYYSIAVGANTHRPRPPEQTFGQRFGDCKDKAVLLVAMLARLGVEARPALVATARLRGVAQWLPTPEVFDHVIVQARAGGKTYWLDATSTYQGRNLANLGLEPFGKALVAGGGVGNLSDVVTTGEGETEVNEVYTVGSFGAPTQLVVVTGVSGRKAEAIRRQLANVGVEPFARALHGDYARIFPEITAEGGLVVNDDRQLNRLELIERYQLPQFFEYRRGAVVGSLGAVSLVMATMPPKEGLRRLPMELGQVKARHRIEIRLPERTEFKTAAPVSLQTPEFAMSARNEFDGRTIALSIDFRTLADQVAAADYPVYLRNLRRAREAMAMSFSLAAAPQTALRDRLAKELTAVSGIANPDSFERARFKFVVEQAVADEAIKAGRLSGKVLAAALKERAENNSLLGRRDLALADIGRAIELDPKPDHYLLRGEILSYLGRFESALADFDRALAGNANSGPVYHSRAQALYYLGRFDFARQDLERAIDLADREALPHALLWLYYATVRSGQDGREVLGKYADRVASTEWPGAAVAMFRGQSSMDELLKSARGDPKEERLRLCEAYFYLGQRALLGGDSAAARSWFEKVLATGVSFYQEHAFAGQELARMRSGGL